MTSQVLLGRFPSLWMWWLITTVAVGWGLATFGATSSDLVAHAAHIQALADGIRHGDWWPWDHTVQCGFDRMPWYSPLFTYSAAILSLCFGDARDAAAWQAVSWLTVIGVMMVIPSATYFGRVIAGVTGYDQYRSQLACALAAMVWVFQPDVSMGYGLAGAIRVGLAANGIGTALALFLSAYMIDVLHRKISVRSTLVSGILLGILMWTHGMSWRLIAALMVIGTVHSCFKQEWAKCSYLASALVLSIIIGAAPLYAGIVEQFMPLYGGIWHDPVALYSMRGYGEWWHVPWIFMELILIGAGIHAMWGRLKYFSSVVVIFLLLLPYEFLTYGGTDWYRSVAPLLLIIGLLGSIHIADAGWLHRDRYSRIINNNLIWSLMLVMAFSEALFVGCPTPSFTVRSPPMADDEHIAHLVPPGARIAIDRSRSERVPWGNQWEAQALHSYETVDGLQFRFASLALSTYNNAASSIFESSYIGMPGIRNYQTPRESLSILRDVFGVQMVFMRKEWYSHRSSIDGYVIKKSDAFDYIQLDGHLGITGVDEPIIDESTTILSWWGSAKAHWLDEPTKPVCSKLTLSGEISKHIPRPFVATRKPSIRVDAAGIELMDVIPGSWYRIPYAYSRMFTSDNSVFGEDQWGLMVVQPRSDQVRIAFDPLAVNAISISLILSTLGFLLSLVAAVITLLWRGRTR